MTYTRSPSGRTKDYLWSLSPCGRHDANQAEICGRISAKPRTWHLYYSAAPVKNLIRVFGLSMLQVSGCGPALPSEAPSGVVKTGDAFDGVQCSALRPPTEPDLMAWDSGSRANLSYLRSQGVVAVRYRADRCNVELEVLSNCIGKGQYIYSPYSATDTKVLHNTRELYAALPIGAAYLGGKLKGGRALRTDYTLVGLSALPPSTTFEATDLRGPDCARATHVVSKVYVGGFAMVAGDAQEIEASGTLFGARAGGSSDSRAEHLAHEGRAEACDVAQSDGTEQTFCSVPLRIGLLAISGRAEGGCPVDSTWDGQGCVQKHVTTEIACPAGSELHDGHCVGSVSRACSAGLHFEDGRGCVPNVVAAAPAPARPPAVSETEPELVYLDVPEKPAKSRYADFDRNAAHDVIVATAANLASCKTADNPTGSGKVWVTFSPNGRVTEVSVGGELAGTVAGGCVARLFRSNKVPPFSGDPVTVSKPFTIP